MSVAHKLFRNLKKLQNFGTVDLAVGRERLDKACKHFEGYRGFCLVHSSFSPSRGSCFLSSGT